MTAERVVKCQYLWCVWEGIRDRDTCLSVHTHLHMDVQTLEYISIQVSLWPEVDMEYLILLFFYVLRQVLSLNL